MTEASHAMRRATRGLTGPVWSSSLIGIPPGAPPSASAPTVTVR